jgi:acyl-ACP thioesterase
MPDSFSTLQKKRSYKFQIQPQDVDFQYRVTMTALGNILLATAGFNADHNGFGMRRLNDINAAWVITRIAIEMSIFPKQYEEISVETWVEIVDRIGTTRNFKIYNEKGKVIGGACTNWVMLDMASRRPKFLDELPDLKKYADDDAGTVDKPMKLEAVGGRLFDKFKVKYSDIDINGHANSMRYIEWVSNCFSLDTYKRKYLKRFEINYMHEVLFGEEIEIFGGEPEKDDFRFEIKKEGKTACRARMLFEVK